MSPVPYLSILHGIILVSKLVSSDDDDIVNILAFFLKVVLSHKLLLS